MAATPRNAKDHKKSQNRDLIDLIFSWSIPDVMNKNLFLGKVEQIPMTFSSTDHYFKSFIHPLIEETHAALYSSLESVSRAPFSEVIEVEKSKAFKLPKNLYYLMSFKKVDEKQRGDGAYKPQSGDLIALTNARPKCIDNLNNCRRPYTLVVVQGSSDQDSDELPVLSSKLVEFEKKEGKKREKLFAVYLINLTTNIRIWKALHAHQEVANLNLIKNILHSDLKAGKSCALCSSNGSKEATALTSRKAVRDLGLDPSQESAVTDCLALKDCLHQNTIKLIWGPPGTGKTKTVSSLLRVLLQTKCRTLACAPTNIAVINVACRLMDLLRPTLEYDTYGTGDVVLFGNATRMKIDDHEDLYDIFLDNRVSALSGCLFPITGWKGSLDSMTLLLEDPEQQYQLYLLKETEKRESRGVDDDRDSKDDRDTFKQFFLKKFNEVAKRLLHCIRSLYTHLPSYLIQVDLAKKMIRACELLRSLGGLISSMGLREALISSGAKGARKPHMNELRMTRAKCLQMLKFLDGSIRLSDWIRSGSILRFCLKSASLIFCTSSSSSKLLTETKKPVELLVIDEAAQLKECESTIPLQIAGIRHAILIGDEMQLPAMVQSKICEKAEFGRSLFERLVTLGYEKHLLKVQYRMHPAISLFPNREFYQNKVKDGPNVIGETYIKRFLDGRMYGPCSFIDINSAKEQFGESHSRKNDVEVFVVAEIVAKLHTECTASKQKCRVGCISPYKAQVYAIQERIGDRYNTSADSGFSVDVRSVDGFQGGEEDVIIISTVRCNGGGSVGFLSNHQRTNVALTRARHCLWILGNSTTLINSGSIWKKLVLDMKARGCFFNANEDKTLVQAKSSALIELKQFEKLLNNDSLLFKTARWKSCFSDEFSRSLALIKDSNTHKKVISIISKLLSGWRPPQEKKFQTKGMSGTSSLLLEMCNVKKSLILIWNVDIQREDSFDIQVMKFQDILPASDIKKLAKPLNDVFENYTMKTISRCACRQVEGKLVVPMKWPIKFKSEKSNATMYEYVGGKVTSQFAAISLKDESRQPLK